MKASENFWKIVTREHSFVIGGNSFHEWFDKPSVETGPCIDDHKELPPTIAESCNTYNMLKLTARLFERKPDAAYADYFERALYNHLLATVAPDNGAVTYFMPLCGNFRTYLNGTFCCTGTGIENTPPVAVPEIKFASENPADWLDPLTGAPLVFKAHGVGPADGIIFRPLYDLHHQRYSVYWNRSTGNP
jgi:hypothetical protein